MDFIISKNTALIKNEVIIIHWIPCSACFIFRPKWVGDHFYDTNAETEIGINQTVTERVI